MYVRCYCPTSLRATSELIEKVLFSAYYWNDEEKTQLNFIITRAARIALPDESQQNSPNGISV